MINLQIREDGVFVELEDNGRKQFREVDVKQIIDIFNKAIKDVTIEEVIESPLLPPGTVKFDKNSSKNEYTLLMYQEPKIAPITFESRSYVIGYPASIYSFKVSNGVLSQVKIWAVKSKTLTPDTPIYHFPFFNIYNDGRVCIGSNKIAVEEPWKLYKMPDMLSAMPTTHALEMHNKSKLEGDSLLKALQDKPYPGKWLMPLNKTLKEVTKGG